jgi:hypothetical protein
VLVLVVLVITVPFPFDCAHAPRVTRRFLTWVGMLRAATFLVLHVLTSLSPPFRHRQTKNLVCEHLPIVAVRFGFFAIFLALFLMSSFSLHVMAVSFLPLHSHRYTMFPLVGGIMVGRRRGPPKNLSF